MDLSCAAEYPESATELHLTGGVWHHLPRTSIDVLLDPSVVGAPATIYWRTGPSTGVGFWDASPVHGLATYRRHQTSHTSSSDGSAGGAHVGRAWVCEG